MTFTKLKPLFFNALLPHHKVAYKIYLHIARLGIGQNKGRWFARVDLWWIGFRLTFK